MSTKEFNEFLKQTINDCDMKKVVDGLSDERTALSTKKDMLQIIDSSQITLQNLKLLENEINSLNEVLKQTDTTTTLQTGKLPLVPEGYVEACKRIYTTLFSQQQGHDNDLLFKSEEWPIKTLWNEFFKLIIVHFLVEMFSGN